MAMPKTTMDEDNAAPARKDEVGFAGEVPAMKSIAVPKAVQEFPQAQFRFGVPALYERHSSASLLRG